jgi:translation initiation factor 2B subunit (eIF-2B alpha/beta/delta family)
MPQVDLVLFGADTVIPERGVVNKAGSTLLALAARQAHKPVLVAAERLKCARNAGPAEPTLESGSPEEIWTECSAGVEISNVYFELVPRELITELILSP